MGDVPLIDADRFLQCGRPANIPEAALRERLLLADGCSPSQPQGLANEGRRLCGGCGFAGLWRRLFATRCQSAWPQFAFAAHYVHYVNRFTFPPIEYAARRFNYLTVAAAA